jgi:hypothetical protein
VAHSCQLAAPYLCELKPPGAYEYNAMSGGRFVYSTAALDFSLAEAFCSSTGGHLAYYASRDEQVGC